MILLQNYGNGMPFTFTPYQKNAYSCVMAL